AAVAHRRGGGSAPATRDDPADLPLVRGQPAQRFAFAGGGCGRGAGGRPGRCVVRRRGAGRVLLQGRQRCGAAVPFAASTTGRTDGGSRCREGGLTVSAFFTVGWRASWCLAVVI